MSRVSTLELCLAPRKLSLEICDAPQGLSARCREREKSVVATRLDRVPPQPEQEAFFVCKRSECPIENVFKIEGDVGMLEGGLGGESGPKCFAIDG
jgi:hypothetical protein